MDDHFTAQLTTYYPPRSPGDLAADVSVFVHTRDDLGRWSPTGPPTITLPITVEVAEDYGGHLEAAARVALHGAGWHLTDDWEEADADLTAVVERCPGNSWSPWIDIDGLTREWVGVCAQHGEITRQRGDGDGHDRTVRALCAHGRDRHPRHPLDTLLGDPISPGHH